MSKKIEYLVFRGSNSKEILEKAKAEGKYIIGLEVTDKSLQSLHDLNIDPQHTDNIEKRIDTSAIDYVLKSLSVKTLHGSINKGFYVINGLQNP